MHVGMHGGCMGGCMGGEGVSFDQIMQTASLVRCEVEPGITLLLF